MGKHKTALTMALALLLTALVAGAAVFGAAAARSSVSDTDEMYAGEDRWKISETTGRTVLQGYVLTESFMPMYGRYDRAEGVRENEFFGVVAVLENDGDVDASVSVTLEDAYEDSGEYSVVLDGCERYDHNFYGVEDVEEHVVFKDLYCSTEGDLTLEDLDKAGEESGLAKVLEGETLVAHSGEKDEYVYFYAHIAWVTDLDRDVYLTKEDGYVIGSDGSRVYGYTVDEYGAVTADGVSESFTVGEDGYIYEENDRVANPDYDGTAGDEFDTWAGLHFSGIAFHVDITCAQAE